MRIAPGHWWFWGPCAMPANEGAGAKLRSGFLWNTGLNMFKELAQFATMLVLVRRLEPSAYGEFGLVTSIIGFFTVISFRSFLEHTFQVPVGEEPDYQNIFTIGGLIQGAIFVLVNLMALAMYAFPGYAAAAPLLQVMSVIFFFDWFHELRMSMLERKLDWYRLRTIQAVGIVISNVCALAMALLGAGVYALLVPGLLVFLPTIYDLIVRTGWRPTWELSWLRFQPAWRYGLTRISSGLLIGGRQMLESALLVHYLGFTGAGVYGRAIGIATIACLRIPSYLTATLYPVLARVPAGTPARSRAGTLVLQSVFWLIVPMAAVMLALAGPIVNMLYGTKWQAATPLLPLALATTGLSALANTLSILLLASGRQRDCLHADSVSSVGVVVSLAVLLPQGAVNYLLGAVAAQVLGVLIMVRGLHLAGALDLPRLGRVSGAAVVTTVLLLAAFSPLYFHVATSVWTPPLIVAFALVFSVGYLACLRTLAGSAFSELVDYFPGRTRIRRMFWLPA